MNGTTNFEKNLRQFCSSSSNEQSYLPSHLKPRSTHSSDRQQAYCSPMQSAGKNIIQRNIMRNKRCVSKCYNGQRCSMQPSVVQCYVVMGRCYPMLYGECSHVLDCNALHCTMHPFLYDDKR